MTPNIRIREYCTSGSVRGAARKGSPFGNLTGTFMRQPQLIAKQLELLEEALPALSSVAVFWDEVID